MKQLICSLLLASAVLAAVGTNTATANAPGYRRQYYSGWSYQPSRRYYVRRYYYRPQVTSPNYSYHYCVYYPQRYSTQTRYSRYVYFYNPQRRVYWGRFDLEGEPGKQYSLLKKADQKSNLDKIPEKAFPTPGKMPVIPDSEDNEPISPMEKTDLPDDSNLDDIPDAPAKP